MRLYGRDAETAALDELLDQARKGASGTLVLRGAPGIGKTALLEWATEHADGFRVMRGTGIEEESELPFAGLHLLLRSGLDRLAAIPAVQAEALRGALGLTKAGSPDRFLVGLAVLSLFADLADDQPLLCLVDDAHWLDRASADALLFAARRLDTESIVLLFGARPGSFPAAVKSVADALFLSCGIGCARRRRAVSRRTNSCANARGERAPACKPPGSANG